MKWPAYIPKVSIDHHVNRMHVSTSDEEIERDMMEAINRHNQKADVQITAVQARKMVQYAQHTHQKNRDLYRAVMSGRL